MNDGSSFADKPAVRRAIYLLAALPFLFFWLLSHGHRGGSLFLVPAALCVVQAIRPARWLGAVLFWGYLALTVWYGWLLVADLIALAGGGRARVLLDVDDSVVFVLLGLGLAAMTFGLFRVWPKRSGFGGDD